MGSTSAPTREAPAPQAAGTGARPASGAYPIHDLPDEVLKSILDRVPLEDQFCVVQVCERWKRLGGPGLFALRVRLPMQRITHPGDHDEPSWSITLEGCHADVKRVAGRLPLTSQRPGSSAPAACPGSQTVSVPLAHRRNSAPLPQLANGAELVSLVGRVPPNKDISTLDLSASVIETRTSKMSLQRPLSRVLHGFSLRLLSTINELQAVGCSILEGAVVPCPQTAILNFSGCSKLKFVSAINLPHLRTLDLTNCRSLQFDNHFPLSPVGASTSSPKEQPPLEHLHISWLTQLSEENLVELAQSATNVQSISLRGIGCKAVLNALRGGQRLENIDLAFSAQIDEQCVSELLEIRKCITRCNLRGCKGIGSNFYKATAKKLHDRLEARMQQLF